MDGSIETLMDQLRFEVEVEIAKSHAMGAGESADGKDRGIPPADDGSSISRKEELLQRVLIVYTQEKSSHDRLFRECNALAELARKHRAEIDSIVSSSFNIKQASISLSEKNKVSEQACRSFQSKNRALQEKLDASISSEQEKTEKMQSEFVNSLSGVREKIDNEANDLMDKKLENESLTRKLDEFRKHLDMHKERVKNEKRALELQGQLEEARKAQRDYETVQQNARDEGVRAAVRHSQETIFQLRKQSELYAAKFGEFESTIDKSGAVIEQLSEKQKILQELYEAVTVENEHARMLAKAENVKLINALNYKEKLELDLRAKREEVRKMEKKCRQLQNTRKEVLARLEDKKRTATTSATVATPGVGTVAAGGEKKGALSAWIFSADSADVGGSGVRAGAGARVGGGGTPMGGNSGLLGAVSNSGSPNTRSNGCSSSISSSSSSSSSSSVGGGMAGSSHASPGKQPSTCSGADCSSIHSTGDERGAEEHMSENNNRSNVTVVAGSRSPNTKSPSPTSFPSFPSSSSSPTPSAARRPMMPFPTGPSGTESSDFYPLHPFPSRFTAEETAEGSGVGMLLPPVPAIFSTPSSSSSVMGRAGAAQHHRGAGEAVGVGEGTPVCSPVAASPLAEAVQHQHQHK